MQYVASTLGLAQSYAEEHELGISSAFLILSQELTALSGTGGTFDGSQSPTTPYAGVDIRRRMVDLSFVSGAAKCLASRCLVHFLPGSGLSP